MTGQRQRRHRAELLFFTGCPHYPEARRLLVNAIAAVAPGTPIEEIDASDPDAARRLRFPGSPTIRIDGHDVDPAFTDPADYTPRCRLYRTSEGLRGLPDPAWVRDALGDVTSGANEPTQ